MDDCYRYKSYTRAWVTAKDVTGDINLSSSRGHQAGCNYGCGFYVVVLCPPYPAVSPTPLCLAAYMDKWIIRQINLLIGRLVYR